MLFKSFKILINKNIKFNKKETTRGAEIVHEVSIMTFFWEVRSLYPLNDFCTVSSIFFIPLDSYNSGNIIRIYVYNTPRITHKLTKHFNYKFSRPKNPLNLTTARKSEPIK